MDKSATDLLQEIGSVLLADKDYPIDGTLLFAEAEQATASCSIFKEVGDQVLYIGPDEQLFDIIMDLWDAHDTGKPWAVMEYQIIGGKFKARFTYPGDADYDPTDYTYREKVVRRYFGDKPIVYPPQRSDVPGLTFKL